MPLEFYIGSPSIYPGHAGEWEASADLQPDVSLSPRLKPPDCALRQHQPQTVKAEGHGSEKETAAGKKRIREKRKRRKKWTNQIARKWGKEGTGEASFVKLL